MIEIDFNDQIENANLILNGVKNGVPIATYRAMNRSLITARSETSKEIRKKYNIKSRDIKDKSNTRITKASRNTLQSSITYAGRVIPLKNFSVKAPNSKSDRLKVAVKKGSKKPLNSAFIANLGKYGPGIFQRQTSQRKSSKQLYGPSVAHMVEEENVLDGIATKTKDMFEKRMDHEINVILKGYGIK